VHPDDLPDGLELSGSKVEENKLHSDQSVLSSATESDLSKANESDGKEVAPPGMNQLRQKVYHKQGSRF